jgi:hypothetical protein
LPVTQADIDALTLLITSGVNSAGYGDKRTEFRSLSDLLRIRDDMQTALNGGSRIRQFRVVSPSDKGL